MADSLLLPDVTEEESSPFWEGTARGELRVQACADCGKRRMPPRPMCPHCRSTRKRWDKLSGRGTIWSFVVPHPPLLPAYQEVAPYNVITVAVDEDPSLRFVGNLITRPGAPINSIDASTIAIGEPVQVVFEEQDGVALPRWMRSVA